MYHAVNNNAVSEKFIARINTAAACTDDLVALPTP
jgi:hypothetical protein